MENTELVELITEKLDYEQAEAFRNSGAVSASGNFSYNYADSATGNIYKAHGKVIGDSIVVRESKYDTNCGQYVTNEESLIIRNVREENFKLFINRSIEGMYSSKQDIKEDKNEIDKLYDRYEEVIADINKGATYKDLAQKYNVEIDNTPVVGRRLR